MANTPVVVLDDTLTNIANAIRGKNGSSDKYKPGQMADAIDNISAGGTGIPREVIDGVYKIPETITSFSLPSNANDVGKNALAYAFYSCPSLTSVDLSSLTKVSGENAFYSAFYNCKSLTSVDLSSLTTVSGNSALASAFDVCTALTSVDFSSLTTVSGYHALYNTFSRCNSLTSLSFPALTLSGLQFGSSQFDNMLYRVTGCTVHFPAAVQSKIEATSGYPNFGGTNTTVLFDL